MSKLLVRSCRSRGGMSKSLSGENVKKTRVKRVGGAGGHSGVSDVLVGPEVTAQLCFI